MLIHSAKLTLTEPSSKIITELNSEKFILSVNIFKETVSFACALQDYQLWDYYSCSSKKQIASQMDNATDVNNDLFKLIVEYKPFDQPGVDIKIELLSNAVLLVYQKKWIDRLGNFFISTGLIQDL